MGQVACDYDAFPFAAPGKNTVMSRHETCIIFPCKSGRPYVDCCGPVIDGSRPAPSADALMRSRYSAFALGCDAWLRQSWHPQTRPENFSTADQHLKWLGLKLIRHQTTGHNTAEVEFVARYRAGGRGGRLHETSRFVREGNQWFYLDGDVHE